MADDRHNRLKHEIARETFRALKNDVHGLGSLSLGQDLEPQPTAVEVTQVDKLNMQVWVKFQDRPSRFFNIRVSESLLATQPPIGRKHGSYSRQPLYHSTA